MSASTAPLHVSRDLRLLRSTATRATADLQLEGARVPAAGGSYTVYLVDLDDPAKPGVEIGLLSFESPAAAGTRTLHVAAHLDHAARAALTTMRAPAIRLVSQFGGPPLTVRRATLLSP